MQHLLSQNQSAYFKQIWQKSDRIIRAALWVYFAFGLGIAIFYDTWSIALGVGTLCLLAFYGAYLILPNSRLHQYVASSIFAIFMAQFIFQMHGLFEMHFFAFVAATLLITYQDWKLFIPLSLIIVVHHAGFAYLQYFGIDAIYFTQLQYMDLQTFIFHASLAVLIICICAFWSFDLAQRTIAQAQVKHTLETELKTVERGVRFASEISKGNLTTVFEDADENNALTKSLMHMQQSLQEAAKREKQEKFISQGLSNINEILRTYINELDRLPELLIRSLVNYLGVNQGGLFLTQSDENENTIYLELKACFAYNRKKFLDRRIEVGEGLVGQAYLERDSLYMTDIPQGYTYITSGLGEATARSILITPLISNEEVVGILELASLSQMTDEQRNFVQRVSESIASAIQTAKINSKTNRLLRNSQQQAEALRAQEEEVRQNMEELSATQEELLRRSNEYDALIKERDREIALLKEQLSSVMA